MDQKITREFETVDELDTFIAFHRKENDINWEWDRTSKRAWITVDGRTAEALGRDSNEEER